MGLTIRHAADGELDIVASLIVDAYAEFAASMAPDAWSMFAQDIANVYGRLSDGEIIVAERDGAIVGTVTVYRDWRGAQPDTLALRLLAVPPSERNSGVGSELMQWAVAEARAAGKRRVVMTAMQVMDALRDMAEKMGFVRARELDHEPAPGVRVEGFSLDISGSTPSSGASTSRSAPAVGASAPPATPAPKSPAPKSPAPESPPPESPPAEPPPPKVT